MKINNPRPSDLVKLAELVFDNSLELTHEQTWKLSDKLMALAGKPAEEDSRTCFGIKWYSSERLANLANLAVLLKGETFNGGWFHGMACGRDSSFDYTPKEGPYAGRLLYAVTVA